MLILNPSPGLYATDQSIAVTGPAGYKVLSSSDGSDPVVVKTVATSNLYAPTYYPYIQTIEDGRGRAIFDGAFSKYYGSSWTSQGNPASFAQLNAGYKFLYNAWNFIRKNNGTKILLLGDNAPSLGDSAGSYAVKSGVAGFNDGCVGLANLMGFSIVVKDRSDYAGNLLDPSYAECMQYDLIMVFSATDYFSTTTPPLITPAGASNIAQARKDGVGVYICTDNNAGAPQNTDRYPEGCYGTANRIIEAITNAYFAGFMDFAGGGQTYGGTTVGYNKALNGDSPLFIGMSDSDVLQSSNSDSFVVQATPPVQALPLAVPVTQGYTTLKFAVIDPDGNVTFEQYSYGVGAAPMIELRDELGDAIEGWEPTSLRVRKLFLEYLPSEFGNASGFIKAGTTVIGEFVNQAAGPVSVNWLDTNYTRTASPGVVQMPGYENLPIVIELYAPFVFEYGWDFNRTVLPVQIVSSAELYKELNKNELATNTLSLPRFIRNVKDTIDHPDIDSSIALSGSIKNITTALASPDVYWPPIE